MVCWGNNLRGQLGTGVTGGIQTTPVPTLVTDAIDIYAGFEFTCALRPNPSGGNRVTCWGENDEGELGRGFTSTAEISAEVDVLGLPSDIVQLGQSAAGAFTCARSSGGGVYCWGFASLGAVGQASNSTVAVRISDASGAIDDAVKVVPVSTAPASFALAMAQVALPCGAGGATAPSVRARPSPTASRPSTSATPP